MVPAVTAVIGLLLTSGCASTQEPKAGAGTPSGTSPTEPAGTPLTMAQLKTLAFKTGEVPQVRGPMAVQEPMPKGSGRTFPPISDSSCEPLLDARSGEGSFAHVFQIFNWKKNIMGGSSTLASYEVGGAEQRFAALKQALATCRSYEGEGYVGKFKVTVKTEAPPQVGDEAVAFREIIPGPEQPQDRNEQFIVVRTGSAIATFSELGFGSGLSFPTELVSRQVERLRIAQRP
ncbi:hypothetical protein [Streptomyces tanashiensis]|uniref:hypothetical protein n=1 Tax=Streptomyces tanashiensis TaxID=67367 RepID=UPI0034246D27